MEGRRRPVSMQKMSVFVKSGVTFAVSLTHAARPLIHSEGLDLSRKWGGGGRRKEEEQREGGVKRSLRIHALLGARSKIKKHRLAEWGHAGGKRRETEELL